jgi:hypothetical protein
MLHSLTVLTGLTVLTCLTVLTGLTVLTVLTVLTGLTVLKADRMDTFNDVKLLRKTSFAGCNGQVRQ